MKLIAVKYEGRKDYRDRTALRTEWKTGDVKRVPEREARQLLKFAEFKRADVAEATDAPGDADSLAGRPAGAACAAPDGATDWQRRRRLRPHRQQ